MHTYTITGEAVMLNLRAANFMPRLGAALIDATIYVVSWIFLLIGVAKFISHFAMDIAASQAVVILAAITLMFIIPLLVEGLSKGRSVGKLIFGLRVVRDDGATIRWRHAFIRCLTGVFELWMTAGSVAIIASLFNRQYKRLGDMMAGTFVIMARAPRPASELPQLPAAMHQWAQVADVGRIPTSLATQVNALIRNASTMQSAALASMAAALSDQMRHYVTPGPPAAVDPLIFLIGVMAERRERDHAVLQQRRQRRERDQQYLRL
ncbi:RDD family protein [Enteractinococcus coprophilus]|uniref:Putative RDD family membrane protein YckC n=1 Tax=Enteractinococcus coprophilus TaxID=1027633 RepID=A0A543AFD0_9MICC|nr:RDD family protein [Enteractinococcus coprophilus]TQL71285.1 putative RDD family membrane protein YckC [Enteractinococcus coprophilus]